MVDRVDQQFGNYRLIRLLGRGGFAEVYLGEHIHLGTQAAIKVLYTQLTYDAVRCFHIEACTIAHLEHLNIVRVLEYGVENTTPFLVMSHAVHGSLRNLYPKGTRVPLTSIVAYVKQAAAALQYAHDLQVIHRDIKPENMLLGHKRQVLLNGFRHSLYNQKASIYWTRRATDFSTLAQDQKVDTSGERPVASDRTLIRVLPISVFQFNEHLTDAGQLYGRACERETLLNRSSKGASTSIVGPRRIGKTWLMSYMRLVAPTVLGSRYRIGYLDATLASCATVAGLAAKALEELDIAHLVPDSTHVGLATLERVVQDLKSNNRVVLLCIDEFEGLGKRQEFTLDLFTSLRAMTQIGLGLVVASRSPLIDIVGDNGNTSGFFNIFEQLTLEPFSLEEAQAFVQTKGVQAGFTDQERDCLLKYGQTEKDQWLLMRLQLVGKMLIEDKTLARKEGSYYYRPNDPDYWRKFKQRLEEKYRGVIR